MFEKIDLFSIIAAVAVLLAILANADRIKSRLELRSQRPSKDEMRPLPDPNENWSTIRERNHLYIDKTPFLMKILKMGSDYFFIRRPPRFGKSMFLDMMDGFFRGEGETFEGLKIAQEGNAEFFEWFMPKTANPTPKWTKFPVIHLKFTEFTNFSTTEEFQKMYKDALKTIASRNNVDDDVSDDIGSLLAKLHLKFNGLPVVVLVDEYDHPFQYALMTLKNLTLARDVKDVLNVIFGTIRNQTAGFGLAFVTGIFKFSLNDRDEGIANFRDLTFDKDLAAAFGFTEGEIEANLGFHMKQFARAQNSSTLTEAARNASSSDKRPVKTIMTQLKIWYSGYQFNVMRDACEVLNPVSTMQSVKNRKFQIYWTNTEACMDYLVREFYKYNLRFSLINKHSISAEAFHYPSEWIMLHHWMLLFGYFTISSYDKKASVYQLKLPNVEVERAIEENLAAYDPVKKAYFADCYRAELVQLKNAMASGNNTGEAMNILRSFVFSPYKYRNGISSEEVSKRVEMIFRSASIRCQQRNIGLTRKDNGTINDAADAHLQTTNLDTNYIIEIKCSGTTALRAIEQQQINCNEVRNLDKIYLLGLGFVIVNGSAQLNDWIVLPCENGTLRYSDAQADPEDLKTKILR